MTLGEKNSVVAQSARGHAIYRVAEVSREKEKYYC